MPKSKCHMLVKLKEFKNTLGKISCAREWLVAPTPLENAMNVFFYVILTQHPCVIFGTTRTPYHDFEPTVFALNPQCYMLSGEAATTNLIVFGLT